MSTASSSYYCAAAGARSARHFTYANEDLSKEKSMRSPMIKVISATLLAAGSLAAGAQTLLTQIPLESFSGDYANMDVAVNSATNRIYVPVQFADYSYASDGFTPSGFTYNYFRLLVINGVTNQVVHNLVGFPADDYYYGIAIDPVRNFIYVEMYAGPGEVGRCTVSVVAGQTEEIVKTIPLPAGDLCGKMVVDPVTGKVYIRASTELDVIESEATGNVESFSLPGVGVFGTIEGLAVSPYVHRLYFTYSKDIYPQTNESLGFFNTFTDQIGQETVIPATIDSYTNPVVNPSTGHIFGTNPDYIASDDFYSDAVTVYESSGNLLANIVLPVNDGSPGLIFGMDVDPKTNLAFVFAESNFFALDVIDGASNTFRSGLNLSPANAYHVYGGSVALNPDTSRVYVPFNASTNPSPNVNGTFYLNVYSEQ
jgi:hypothetical protein